MSSSFNPSIFQGFRPPEADLEARTGSTRLPTDRSVTVRSNTGRPTIKNDFSERLKALFRVRRKSIFASKPDFPIKYREGTWKALKRKIMAMAGTCWSKVRSRVKYDVGEPNPDLEAAAEHTGPKRWESPAAKCAKWVVLQVKKSGSMLKKLTSKRQKTFAMYISPNYKHGMDYEGLVAVVDEALMKFRENRAARKAAGETKLVEAEHQMFLRAQRGVALGGRVVIESVRARDWDWDFDDEDDYYPAC